MAKKQRIRYAVNAGTFAETGNTTNFGESLFNITGSFTLSGSAATITEVHPISYVVSAGVFTETGNTANFGNQNLSTTGTFSFTGSDGTFTATSSFAILPESGTFSTTCNDSVLTGPTATDRDFQVSTGNFSMDVQGVTLTMLQNPFACHEAFQEGAFQFNAFQMCLTVAPPIPEEPHIGGRIDGPEFSNRKWQEFYRNQAIHDAAVRLGKRGALARWGGPTLPLSGRWGPLKAD